jgi:hypothetical protein
MERQKTSWTHISKGMGRNVCGKQGSSTTDPLRSDCPECMKTMIDLLESKLKEMVS